MTKLPTNIKKISQETLFLLPGPAGDLEVLLSAAPPQAKKEAIAIICHPHPLYGGTMTNKVVTTLSKVFVELQMQTVRFNFRGVGNSAGSYANGAGELDDLLAIKTWVKEQAPQAEIWLAGFSFGSFIAIRAAQQELPAGLVTIAPPVNHFPLNEKPQLTCPWIVVQGGRDDVVPEENVLTWLAQLNPQPRLIHFPQAGHFFHGALTELKEALLAKLSRLS